LPRASTIYTELSCLLEFIVAGEPATAAKSGRSYSPGTVRRPALTIAPADGEGRAKLHKLATDG